MQRGIKQAWECWKHHKHPARVLHLHKEWIYIQWYCTFKGCPYVYAECQVIMTQTLKEFAVYEGLSAVIRWLYKPYVGSGKGREVLRIRLADWLGWQKMVLLSKVEKNGTTHRAWL